MYLDIAPQNQGRVLPSAGNGSEPCGPPPDPLHGQLFRRPEPEPFL